MMVSLASDPELVKKVRVKPGANSDSISASSMTGIVVDLKNLL